MKLYMTGQEKCDLLIQVTAQAGLTQFSKFAETGKFDAPNTYIHDGLVQRLYNKKWWETKLMTMYRQCRRSAIQSISLFIRFYDIFFFIRFYDNYLFFFTDNN